jgi:hypothetical protein
MENQGLQCLTRSSSRQIRRQQVYYRLLLSYLLSNRMRCGWRKINLRIGDVTRKILFSDESERIFVDPCG